MAPAGGLDSAHVRSERQGEESGRTALRRDGHHLRPQHPRHADAGRDGAGPRPQTWRRSAIPGLIWSTGVTWLVWGAIPGAWMLIGAAVVASSSLFYLMSRRPDPPV